MPSILDFLLTAKSHPDTLTSKKQIPGSHIIKRRHNMAKVTREMVEKTGINVDELVQLLVNNAAAELTTFYYYTILRVNLIGLEGEGVKEIAETARIEDRNHFEALVPRIYELGGKLPEDMKAFHDTSACPPATLPKDPRDIQAMLQVLGEAERGAGGGPDRVRAFHCLHWVLTCDSIGRHVPFLRSASMARDQALSAPEQWLAA